MRQHLGWYVRNVPDAAHLRRTLLKSYDLDDALTTLETYLARHAALPATVN